MAVTRERFNQGMTYEEIKAVMPRNLAQMEQFERDIKLSEGDLAPWRGLSQKYSVLVLAIDPCPDVQANLPILERIARETGKLDVRYFMRDENKDLMAQYMNGPYESVPVFAFYDEAFNLQSVFIERPKSVTELRAQKTRELYAQDASFGPVGTSPSQMPEDARERYGAAIRRMRADTTGFYLSESIRELGEIARELAAKPVTARWWGNLVAVPA
jgi:hypothetical protein